MYKIMLCEECGTEFEYNQTTGDNVSSDCDYAVCPGCGLHIMLFVIP